MPRGPRRSPPTSESDGPSEGSYDSYSDEERNGNGAPRSTNTGKPKPKSKKNVRLPRDSMPRYASDDYTSDDEDYSSDDGGRGGARGGGKNDSRAKYGTDRPSTGAGAHNNYPYLCGAVCR